MHFTFPVWAARVGALTLFLTAVSGCTHAPRAEPAAAQRKEVLVAVTAGHELVRFKASEPGRFISRVALSGLAPGERLVGVDYRVAKGVLYALGRSGQLYTVDTSQGRLTPVGAANAAVANLSGDEFGFDFNPTVDRIRVVTTGGQNLRLHPDTGAQVDGDPNREGIQRDGDLHYAAGDVHAGRAPAIAAAGYTYNTRNDKITTNYAIDRALGTLVIQGSREGTEPVVSPNSGQLRTVGSLGLGSLNAVSLDISDVGNVALMAARSGADPRTRLYQVDLESGRATLLGQVGAGAELIGMGIEP